MIMLKVNDKELRFEHSLASLSEWESYFERPFFPPKLDESKTIEEMISYFECMLVSSQKNRHLIRLLTEEQMTALVNYMNKSSTATVVREIQGSPGQRENVTSELIYYWMVSFKIPFSPADQWHLNRLLMLIKVCGIKSAPVEKQNKAKLAQSFRDINEARRRESGSSG